MYIHFIGVGGSLMGHLAVLAQQAGHRVSGSDQNLYPPMSEVIAAHKIPLSDDEDLSRLRPVPDLFVLGNARMKRGHPAVEYLLSENLPFVSGAQWLGENILRNRWTLAVSGTHGKTTTTAMLAFLLDRAGLDPGFLVGGVPQDFPFSARLGGGRFFVVEADEYDTSYFDRRAKFVHYHPRTLIFANLEYDHADIFPDLEAIEQQFHTLLRRLPSNGLLVAGQSSAIDKVLDMGLWTPTERFGCQPSEGPPPLWRSLSHPDGSFEVWLKDKPLGTVRWSLTGQYNQLNALAALAAARHAGVAPAEGIDILTEFSGVKRRMEKLGTWGNLSLYDDFAHHPTAIAETLAGLRQQVGGARILAIIEPASHTMKRGDLLGQMASCATAADRTVWVHNSNQRWTARDLLSRTGPEVSFYEEVDPLIGEVTELCENAVEPWHVVCMSNGAFQGLQGRLTEACSLAHRRKTAA